jgi:ribosomal protein S18 acetylase RimI-like enzyme
MDITLSPDWRNQGIGSYLICQLIQEAQLNICTLELYVEPYNPALKLYQRLGFAMQEVHGAYYRLQWQNSTTANPPQIHLGDIG